MTTAAIREEILNEVIDTFDPMTAISIKREERDAYMQRLYRNAEIRVAKRHERIASANAAKVSNFINGCIVTFGAVLSLAVLLVVFFR